MGLRLLNSFSGNAKMGFSLQCVHSIALPVQETVWEEAGSVLLLMERILWSLHLLLLPLGIISFRYIIILVILASDWTAGAQLFSVGGSNWTL